MIPGIDHWYACVAELTPGMLRWDVARNRCRDRHDLFRALGRITETMHMTTIKTAEGVAEAGPDEPALAAATQREENARAAAMEDLRSQGDRDREWAEYLTRCSEFGEAPLERSVWEERTRVGGLVSAGSVTASCIDPNTGRVVKPGARVFPGGPVGRVDERQVGILPTGPKQVTDDMVHRAQTVLMHAENPAGASAVRKALEAALQG